jgi:hypothetical protein
MTPAFFSTNGGNVTWQDSGDLDNNSNKGIRLRRQMEVDIAEMALL